MKCVSLIPIIYSIFLIFGLKKVFKKVKLIEIFSIRIVVHLYNSSILHEKFTSYFTNITWLNHQYLSNLILPISYSNCKLCKKTIKSPIVGNSKSNDLIISFIYGRQFYNFLTFARSLRTTGSRATIILFASSQWISKCPPKLLSEFKKCGFILEVFTQRFQERSPLFLRFYLYYEFLQYHQLFHRIIICDIFDTLFQYDPFNPNFPEFNAVATMENHDLTTNINGIWMEAADLNYNRSFYKGKNVLCMGLLFGGSRPLFKLLQRYLNYELLKKVPIDTNDQTLLNYMFYHNELDDLLIVDSNGTNMVSATNWFFEKWPNKNGLMAVKSPVNGAIPSTIHQYDRSCYLSKFIKNICPALGKWHDSPFTSEDFIFQECE